MKTPGSDPGRNAFPRHTGLLVAAALLAACATRPSSVADGPGARPPAGLAQVPDAVPRIEPVRAGGPNKPYEVLGQRYVPLPGDPAFAETGGASWYGRKFHGQSTASGEPYDMYAMTAAHKTLPIPSYARVRNPANGREVVVRINDRGPFVAGRIVDLSYTAALKLGVLNGVTPVELARITHDEIRNLAATREPRAAPPQDDLAPGDSAPAGGDGHWLQIGAFRQRDGALQLRQRLLGGAESLPAVAIREDGGIFRVQVGPYASRELALAAAERLQQGQGLSSMLVEPARPGGPAAPR